MDPTLATRRRALLIRSLVACAVGGLATVAVAGCGSGVAAAGKTPVTTTSAVTSPSPPASATTSATSSAPATVSAPAARPRTTALLTTALLGLDDLPPGWSVDNAAPGAGGGSSPSMTTTSAACQDFVALGSAASAPGSKASATTSFSAGQDGPFIDEGIDYLGSKVEVATLLARVAAANRSCRTVSLTLPGAGRSTVDVAVVSPPRVGDHPVAVRITARGGDLDGLEMTQVVTGVDDTVVSLTLVGAVPDDVVSSTEDAVAKARDTLKVESAGI